VTDLVTIGTAEAVCSILAPKTCSLTVTASSSDATGLPALTLGLYNAPLVAGSVTLNGLLSVPGSVSVSSAALGVASKPVTITNK
jgi:ABC-type phosphate transport system permease subunit